METEFIYWRHHTLPGIKVEEVCGGEDKPMPLWIEMAYQIYSENGKEMYREIGHFRTGAPFLIGESSRISVTHTDKFLAIATLPPTPEVELNEFSERAALGIDAEKRDRSQVLKIRKRFLSPSEIESIPEEDVMLNVLAWTCKEAIYKAVMGEGIDFMNDIKIIKLPKIGPAVPLKDAPGIDSLLGEGMMIEGTKSWKFNLYSYESEGNIVTLAYSPKCAKFGVNAS